MKNNEYQIDLRALPAHGNNKSLTKVSNKQSTNRSEQAKQEEQCAAMHFLTTYVSTWGCVRGPWAVFVEEHITRTSKINFVLSTSLQQATIMPSLSTTILWGTQSATK
eukprot:scaffold21352_cov66-Skeletonema_marinoi.AAC.1